MGSHHLDFFSAFLPGDSILLFRLPWSAKQWPENVEENSKLKIRR